MRHLRPLEEVTLFPATVPRSTWSVAHLRNAFTPSGQRPDPIAYLLHELGCPVQPVYSIRENRFERPPVLFEDGRTNIGE